MKLQVFTSLKKYKMYASYDSMLPVRFSTPEHTEQLDHYP